MRAVSVPERRARLVRRHHLAPDAPGADVEAVAERLVGLHASDPATVFLSARARVPGLAVDDVEDALYERCTIVKHLCMRGTMFVLPVSLIPAVQAASTETVLVTARKRLLRDVEQAGIARDGRRWLRRAEQATLEALGSLGSATGAQLSRAVPELRGKIMFGEGKKWGGEVGVSGRVFLILAASGRIRRGRPAGSWTSSQHRWVLAPPDESPRLDEAAAIAELVRRWLHAFGPAPVSDVVWWTGLGVRKVGPALAAIGAVEVELDGEQGVVLPDDVEPEPPAEPSAALLPSLDPTTMGWQRRDWYLGDHAAALFDRNGNAGPTVWWDGRIVGGWTQRTTGGVVYRLLEDAGAEAAAAIEAEAARLQAWLGPTVVTTRFPTPLDRELRA